MVKLVLFLMMLQTVAVETAQSYVGPITTQERAVLVQYQRPASGQWAISDAAAYQHEVRVILQNHPGYAWHNSTSSTDHAGIVLASSAK